MLIFSPSEPYNTLPLLPPSAELDSKAILKKCITARANLAQLNTNCKTIPNPLMLLNTLSLLEAKDSTEIENIVTTTDKLFRHALAGTGAVDGPTKEALNYRNALFSGVRSLEDKPLSTSTAEAVCSILQAKEMKVRKVPGTTLANQTTGERIYTPPVGEDLLRQKLSNLETFMHTRSDVDPLIKMAVAHYQFEAIHPFTDGNGRTGRIFNILYLLSEGLLSQPVLYLSRHILATRNDYYQGLLEVTTKGAWSEWIIYVLEAVSVTAMWSNHKINAICALLEDTVEKVRLEAPRFYTRELVELLFTQPYCRIAQLEAAGIAKRETASKYLHDLTQLGVLHTVKDGRDKLFINSRLMEVLSSNEHSYSPL